MNNKLKLVNKKKASALAFISMHVIKRFNLNAVPLKCLDTVPLMTHFLLEHNTQPRYETLHQGTFPEMLFCST